MYVYALLRSFFAGNRIICRVSKLLIYRSVAYMYVYLIKHDYESVNYLISYVL